MRTTKVETALLWCYPLVRHEIKRVDETYNYLVYKNGYLPLKRNTDWHGRFLPYYRLGTWRSWGETKRDEFRPYFFRSIDELSHFFSIFAEDYDNYEEIVIPEKDTWLEAFQTLYPEKPLPIQKEPLKLVATMTDLPITIIGGNSLDPRKFDEEGLTYRITRFS